MRTLRKAYLEITNVCNLSCAFCPGTRKPASFLSPEDFHTLAAKLRPHTQYLYLHLMGEPLLHPRLDAILAQAEELGFHVMLTTNGTLLGILLAAGIPYKKWLKFFGPLFAIIMVLSMIFVSVGVVIGLGPF